jgi:thiamine biosynthesis lipoprotein
MKNIFYSILTIVLLVGCESSINNTNIDSNEASSNKKVEFYGNTQGTTYAVICNDSINLTHNEIDNRLREFDLALSSYIPESILSKLNNSPAGKFVYRDTFNFFNRCLEHSREVYNLTNGAFDPTVYPLVDGWGFMKNIENVPDSSTVDSLRSLIGFTNGYHFSFYPSQSDSSLEDSKITKHTPNVMLDFNAIAQGLSVDVICELLDSKGAKNYFVEIGGEIRVKGNNSRNEKWSIGIDKPIENSTAQNRELQEIIYLDNKAVATSGSYRKFYEKEGVKYSHTLDPKTGYPVTHTLLSTTVVAENCALADGLATGFMVLGAEKTVKLIKSGQLPNVEVYLIFYNKKKRIETYKSSGFNELLKQ